MGALGSLTIYHHGEEIRTLTLVVPQTPGNDMVLPGWFQAGLVPGTGTRCGPLRAQPGASRLDFPG